MFFFKLS